MFYIQVFLNFWVADQSKIYIYSSIFWSTPPIVKAILWNESSIASSIKLKISIIVTCYLMKMLFDIHVIFFNFSEKGDFCFIKYFLFELFVSVEFISLMFYFLFLRSCQLVSHMSTKTLDKSQSRKTLIFLDFMGRHLRHLKASFSFCEIFFRNDEN